MGFDDLNEDANFMQKLTFFINNVLTPNVSPPPTTFPFPPTLVPMYLRNVMSTTRSSQERTESNINIELTQLIERKNAVYKKQVGPNLLRSVPPAPLTTCHGRGC